MVKAPIHAAAKITSIVHIYHQSTSIFTVSTIPAAIVDTNCNHAHNSRSKLLGSPLGGVTKEANRNKESLGHFSAVETLERPCTEHVLQALSRHSIAHFACHGLHQSTPQTESILHDLYRKEVDKLRVEDIAALKLPKARLAYLSACSTAEILRQSSLIKYLRFVRSSHIAGFAHVIGALWSS
ncbi:CHAT domain-containing protein [Terfezia claveryi]|nr:CHAT domain-containing protein [Terfezia claveryi]